MFNKRQRSKPDNVACIFVHAGAGYHSEQNEAIHLQACNDAVNAGMAILKAGGSAIDAVEMAIKVLEDREITNAGYGSNLTMDGVVECDAVVVDHNGRSGGTGAVSQIKNPVSLARLLLDLSATELSLRRVPPNFLVGQGATDFAWSHGIPLVQHEVLISPNARGRWQRWKADLRAAAQKERHAASARVGLSPSPDRDIDMPRAFGQDRSHGLPMEQSLFNDAQPISPPISDPITPSAPFSAPTQATMQASLPYHSNNSANDQANALRSASGNPFMNSTQNMLDSLDTHASRASASPPLRFEGLRSSRWSDESQAVNGLSAEQALATPPELPSDPRVDPISDDDEAFEDIDADMVAESLEEHNCDGPRVAGADKITDTVGAIAIDHRGNIACAASSGGIGMKHRGRVGPAALVSIGACVLPAQSSDPLRTTVATVTSGTGEHMATTQAASTCSARILYSQKRSTDGTFEEVTEDEAVRDFIAKDFMEHPSVMHSKSAGAIGVLSVKKTQDGAWLYFAHNTDSFALASMSTADPQPVVTMSRNRGQGKIAGGGRAIRFQKRAKTAQQT